MPLGGPIPLNTEHSGYGRNKTLYCYSCVTYEILRKADESANKLNPLLGVGVASLAHHLEHDGERHAAEPVVAPATSVASTSSPNRWLFSGKESQSILNASIPLLDFGVRMYNPAIARWTAADPLSEKYYGISPYVYCLGNPISHIDDDGQMPQVVVGALIGAAVGGIIAAAEGKNWREIGGAAVGGAVEGALVSATGGMSLLGSKAVATVLSAGAASAAGSTANQLIGEGSVEAKQVAWDAEMVWFLEDSRSQHLIM